MPLSRRSPSDLLPSRGAVAVLLARRDRFLSFLERRLGSREAAEDVLQDAYARGLAKIDTLRAGESAVAWFYRLLRHAVVDAGRRRDAQGRALSGLRNEIEAERGAAPAESRSICGCVSVVLEGLKPEYRRAIRAVDVEGQSVRAMAEQAAISPNNAAVRLHRARGSFAARLRARCGACAAAGCCRDCWCAAVSTSSA